MSIIVLRANQTQYNQLNGYYNNFSKLEFTLDGNGDWIVGLEVLNDENFSEIKPLLDTLEPIEFVRPLGPEG
jgi:hypothetical protein